MTVLNPQVGKQYIFSNPRAPEDPDNGKVGTFQNLTGIYGLLKVLVPDDAPDGALLFPDDPGGVFMVWSDELTEVEV